MADFFNGDFQVGAATLLVVFFSSYKSRWFGILVSSLICILCAILFVGVFIVGFGEGILVIVMIWPFLTWSSYFAGRWIKNNL